MKGKSYVNFGSVSMGIAGSIVDQTLFERTLGMRVEAVDMTEVARRIDRNIYDPDEFRHALAWSNSNLIKGKDYNPPHMQHAPEQQDAAWKFLQFLQFIRENLILLLDALLACSIAILENGI